MHSFENDSVGLQGNSIDRFQGAWSFQNKLVKQVNEWNFILIA